MTPDSKLVGAPMLISIPKYTDSSTFTARLSSDKEYSGYYDSNEGGLAFFFIVPQKGWNDRRQVCIAGDIYFPEQDIVVTRKYRKQPMHGGRKQLEIDAGLLIGSTTVSLRNNNGYFEATYDDLTQAGRDVHLTLENMYGKGNVDIVTLLDT